MDVGCIFWRFGVLGFILKAIQIPITYLPKIQLNLFVKHPISSFRWPLPTHNVSALKYIRTFLPIWATCPACRSHIDSSVQAKLSDLRNAKNSQLIYFSSLSKRSRSVTIQTSDRITVYLIGSKGFLIFCCFCFLHWLSLPCIKSVSQIPKFWFIASNLHNYCRFSSHYARVRAVA